MNPSLLPKSLQNLVEQFSRLPGVGEKTALRYALAILREQKIKLQDLVRALEDIESHVGTCPTCFFWTDDQGCSLCSSTNRDDSKLCVVRDSPDILAIERFRPQSWRYHVLQGLLSPLQGIRPQHLKIEELSKRLENSPVQEIILAIDATLEGDATCLFLRDYLKERFPHIRLMRTASGLPAGSSVEYLDASTLERALQNRLPFDP